jgi:hypothetical protein
MQKKHSSRLWWSVEYAAIVLMCTVLLGLMGCKESEPLSSEKEITGFSIGVRETGTPVPGKIQLATREIVVSIPVTANLETTWLIPTIEVSANATVSPASGAAQDFSKPVVYTVTAEDGSAQDYLVLTSITGKTTDKQITAFTIPGQKGNTVLSESEKTIDVTMPVGTDMRALIPTIAISANATVSPASEVAQDFSKPMVYTVTAQDGTTRDYTVVVQEAAKSNVNTIATFTIPDGTPTPITATTKTITVTMPVGTDVRALIPTITLTPTGTGTDAVVTSTVSPTSLTARDFTGPVVYTVTAQDGTTRDYTVVVQEAPRSGNKAISRFTINNVEPEVPIAAETRLITFKTSTTTGSGLPVGINVKSLIPVIEVDPTATVRPASLVAQDFSKPVVYTVTAQDGSTQDYTVVVQRSSDKDIIDPTIPMGTVVVNDTIIAVTMPVGTNATRLAPTFILPAGASASPASGTPQNFFQESQTYTVTAEDGSTKEFVVAVMLEDPQTGVTIDLAGTDKGIVIYSTPALVDNNIRLSLNGGSGTYPGSLTTKEAVVSIQVTKSTNWKVTGWKVDGRAYPNELYGTTSNIITLKASNYFIGRHSVTFTVEVNGMPYSEQFYFTVDK